MQSIHFFTYLSLLKKLGPGIDSYNNKSGKRFFPAMKNINISRTWRLDRLQCFIILNDNFEHNVNIAEPPHYHA